MKRGLMAVTSLPPCDQPRCQAPAKHRLVYGYRSIGTVVVTYLCRHHLDTIHMPRMRQQEESRRAVGAG